MSDESAWNLYPEQVFFEILIRLPAKSIYRFKCVSKSWHRLICHPHFITSYLSLSSPKWTILDRFIRVSADPYCPALSFKLPDPPSVGRLTIEPGFGGVDPPDGPSTPVVISGSDGLILFSVSARRDPVEEYKNDRTRFCRSTSETRLFVCSPVTGQWAGIPRPEGFVMDIRNVGLATRRAYAAETEVGFVVAEYRSTVGSDIATLMVFSSETGEWENRPVNFMPGMEFWRPGGTFYLGGSLFWIDVSVGLIAWDCPFSAWGEEREREECQFVPLPQGCERPFHLHGLEDWKAIGVSGDFVQYTEKLDNQLQVFRLKGYGNGGVGEWELVHQVRLAGGRLGEVKFRLGHPFDADLGFFTVGHQMVCVNLAERKVLGSGAAFLKGGQTDGRLVSVVIPTLPVVIPPTPSLHALSAKNSGNDHFERMEFEEAISCYSRSICRLPMPVAYANRAAAYLKLSRFLEAEHDCTEAIKLDGQCMKAYVHRAVARKELGRLKDAKEDVELVLKKEPHHQELKIFYTEIKSLLEQAYANEGGVEDQTVTLP